MLGYDYLITATGAVCQMLEKMHDIFIGMLINKVKFGRDIYALNTHLINCRKAAVLVIV